MGNCSGLQSCTCGVAGTSTAVASAGIRAVVMVASNFAPLAKKPSIRKGGCSYDELYDESAVKIVD